MADPSFRFRLERVRALRERREEVAREELARAIVCSRRSREQLDGIEENLEQARREQRGALDTGAGGEQLRAHQAFLERVEREREAGESEMRRTEAEVAARGEDLGRASRDRQSLERLKERHRSEHLRELRRREALVMDQLAIERFRRSAA